MLMLVRPEPSPMYIEPEATVKLPSVISTEPVN